MPAMTTPVVMVAALLPILPALLILISMAPLTTSLLYQKPILKCKPRKKVLGAFDMAVILAMVVGYTWMAPL